MSKLQQRHFSLVLVLAFFGSVARVGADPGLEPALELREALAVSADLERGRTAYQSCAVCHGIAGAGQRDGIFPQLAGQHASVIMKQLVDIREGRRLNPVMLPYAQRLMDAQEIADVAAYLAVMPRPADNGRGPGEALALGGDLYARDCRRCHGEHGEGDAARFLPALAGQHYGYLLRQIRDTGGGRRGNAHPEMTAIVEAYNDAEVRALADYASRLRVVESSSMPIDSGSN